MSLTEHRRFIQVSIAGEVVKTTEDVSITEAIDNLCTVAEFTLAAMPIPEPAIGDDVLIEWIELDTIPLTFPMFGGTISAIDVDSEPWQFTVRCVDQLELLRKIKNGSDMDLTGMTEGEAVQAVLDYCGVDYDIADIADTGYVLGDQVDVKWLKDGTTSGAQIIAELNRVFRMSLFTIGNNRVIRLPYDPTPADGTGAYATYEKGVDIEFDAHHRTYGDRDRVQNVWVVRGATRESNDGSCSRTVWARAEDGGLLVGTSRRARVAMQEFPSDLIQDEALAEAIVRRLMQDTNRLPDDGSAILENDPNLHQCSKIAIVDPQYGIEANPRYFLVRSVARTGLTMSLELTAGPPGADGTVTHGVDKVCTDVHTDDDWPGPGGGFDWADPEYPPVDPGTEIPDFAIPDFGSGFDVAHNEADALPIIYCDSDPFADGIAVEAVDWQITGTLTLTGASQRLTIGVTSDDGDYLLTIAGVGYYAGLSAPPEHYEMATPDAVRHAPGPVPLDTPIDWLLRWTQATNILQCQIDTPYQTFDDFKSYPAATMANAETTHSLGGLPTRADETVEHNCSETPPTPGGAGCFLPTNADWNTGGYSVTLSTGNVQFDDGSEGAEITLNNPSTIVDTAVVTISAHVEFSGPGNGTTDDPIASFILQQTSAPFAFAGVQVEWNSVTNDGFIYVQGFAAGFQQETITDAEIYNGFDLHVILNPVSNVVSYVLDKDGGGSYANAVALDPGAGIDSALKLNFASASALQETITALGICIGGDLLIVGDWVEDSNPGNHTFGSGSDAISVQGAAHNTSASKGIDEAWVLVAEVTPSTVNSAQIGLGADGLSFEYYALVYATSEGGGVEVGSLADTAFDATDLSSGSLTITLAYDGASTLTATFDDGMSQVTISCAVDNIGFPPATPLYPGVRCYTTAAGGASFDQMSLT